MGKVWNRVRMVSRMSADLLFLGVLACVGGIMNHMRGEDGGMIQGAAFTSSQCTDCIDYWIDHLYDRAIMAFPTGALLSFLTRR